MIIMIPIIDVEIKVMITVMEMKTEMIMTVIEKGMMITVE